MKIGIRITLAFFTLVLTSDASAATVEQILGYSVRKLRSRNYQEAINRTRPLLDRLKLDTVEEIILAHRILGVSYCELGDQPKAVEHFKTLLTFSPTETIDDLVRSKPCKSLFANLQQGRSHIRVPAVGSQQDPNGDRRVVVQSAPTEEPLTPGIWKRFIPFGVGQFANRQSGKGIAFLAGETAATGLAITSFFLFKGEKNADGTFSNAGLASTYRTMYWSATGVGIGLAAWGIIDAVFTYNKKRDAYASKGLTFRGTSLAYYF